MHSRTLTRIGRVGLLVGLLSGLTVHSAWADGSGTPPPPPVIVTPGGGHGGVRIGVNDPGSGATPTGGGGNTIIPAGVGGGAYQGGTGTSSNPFFPGNVATSASFPLGCPPDPANAAWVAFCNPPAVTPGAPAQAAPPPPPPSIALAQAAWGELVMPVPVPSRYPSGRLPQDGHPYTIVKANTWFWTDPATWQPVSKTVTAGAVWGKATATPVKLSFSPGDGSRSVSCAGPGSAWKANDQTWLAPVNPQGCSYRYTKSSLGVGGDDQVTAAYTITWNVTWSGSDGTSGVFNNMQTSTDSRFAVAEVQTVVTS